jgi:hypothetical protein
VKLASDEGAKVPVCMQPASSNPVKGNATRRISDMARPLLEVALSAGMVKGRQQKAVQKKIGC